MKEIFFGEYIKRRRKELGLLQKELASGICDSVTISRLENGRQYPSHRVMVALLQRLDLSAERYVVMLSDKELQIENLIGDISGLTVQFDLADDSERDRIRQCAYMKMAQLEEIAAEEKSVQQYLLATKAQLGPEDGSTFSMEQKLSLLLDAIGQTVLDFDLAQIGKHLYSLDEIRIINQIAGVYTNYGHHQTCADILGQLLDYVQHHSQHILEGRGHFPMIAVNYARTLNLCGRNEESLKAAETARQACIQYKNYQVLPRILHVMATTHHDLGNHQQSRQLYYQAYHICIAIDDHRDLALLRKDAQRHYGINFENTPEQPGAI